MSQQNSPDARATTVQAPKRGEEWRWGEGRPPGRQGCLPLGSLQLLSNLSETTECERRHSARLQQPHRPRAHPGSLRFPWTLPQGGWESERPSGLWLPPVLTPRAFHLTLTPLAGAQAAERGKKKRGECREGGSLEAMSGGW